VSVEARRADEIEQSRMYGDEPHAAVALAAPNDSGSAPKVGQNATIVHDGKIAREIRTAGCSKLRMIDLGHILLEK